MSPLCKSPGCKHPVPEALGADRLCVAHFLAEVEKSCGDIRRETAARAPAEERREIIEQFIAARGELLARVATSKLRLPDEVKARILNTFLTLMNLRENLERSMARAR
jgi:hypothetical protein